MNGLRGYSLTHMHSKLALPDSEFDDWLVELGLLHSCPNCLNPMSRKRANLVKTGRYGPWKCSKKACKGK